MKKLLYGLLILGSLSAFASEVSASICSLTKAGDDFTLKINQAVVNTGNNQNYYLEQIKELAGVCRPLKCSLTKTGDDFTLKIDQAVVNTGNNQNYYLEQIKELAGVCKF